MKLHFAEAAGIPALAWCATIEAGAGQVSIRHGPAVETGAGFLIEGAWDGDFANRLSILSASVAVGTGCIAGAHTLTFFTGTDTLTRLYAIRSGSTLFIANSLAFALAESGEQCSDGYLFYDDDLKSIRDGLIKRRDSIPTAAGNRVCLYYHCNVEVAADLSRIVHPKQMPPAFPDFARYRSFLGESLARLAANANDDTRRRRYRPLATVSTGYDSPASAALAKAIGCHEAITFFDPADPVDPFRDSGEAVAAGLGLEVRVFERDAYKRREDFVEAEFLTAGTGGGDVFLSVAEEILAGRLLFTGFHGDKVWDPNNEKVGPDIVRGDASGIDLEEFRLRVGFLNVPVPFQGCQRHADIRAIGQSQEMDPWRLGGRYDRPIPRRIAEEAGVARQSFGQDKKVMSRGVQMRDPSASLAWYFGRASELDFRKFADPKARTVRGGQNIAFALPHLYARFLDRVARRLGRLSWRTGRLLEHLQRPVFRYLQPADSSRFRFHWGISKVLARYRSAK